MSVFSKLADKIIDFGTKKSNPRGSNRVERITPHHMAGKMLAEDCARGHMNDSYSHSAQYYIGFDGRSCGGVSEDRRAWTSSSRANDYTAITIEVSNDGGAPDWHIPDAAYTSLVNLCADICQRYGIDPHFDGTKEGTITMHKQFTATDCPGPHLEKLIRSGKLEKDIKAAMSKDIVPSGETKKALYRVQTGAFKVLQNAKNMQLKLEKEGFETYIVKVSELYKVQTGAFSVKKNAEDLVKKLETKGFEAIITQADAEAVKESTDKDDKKTVNGYTTGESYKVIASKGLNIRTGAGTGNTKIGAYVYGNVVTVEDISTVGNETWIKTESGWCCAIGRGKYIG